MAGASKSVGRSAEERKLHLSRGGSPLPGWVNLDAIAAPGVDVVADLDDCERTLLPFAENHFDWIVGHRVLERLRSPLAALEDLHRVAKPDAKLFFHLPYGSSDDALEDPTNVRPYFVNSFLHFAQPAHAASSPYRGDWQPDRIVLRVKESRHRGRTAEAVMEDIRSLRNVVVEMIAQLTAVKPIRARRRDLLVPPRIEIQLV